MLKPYTLLGGSLYFTIPGGALCRCLGPVEAKEKLEHIHSSSRGHNFSTPLHRKIQRAGFYWPDMIKHATVLQDGCEGYQETPQYQEICVVDTPDDDWRIPYLDYLSQNISPSDKNLALKIEKEAKRFFVIERKLFSRSFNQHPLKYLDAKEALRAMEVTHDGEH